VTKGQLDRRTNSYNLTESGQHLIERRREWESQYVDEALLPA
jgi:DNA-binding PadR family transcriptional regulator